MREIKFKAYDIVKRKMYTDLQGFKCTNDNPYAIFLYLSDGTSELTVFDHIKLMQYIGLRDKNSQRIYEGDIMYVAGIGNMIVVFRNGSFALDNKTTILYFHEDMEKDIENVVGNIYENPELLKKV